ncbi:TRAP transporter small permease subunit [Providencia rettgeri]|uniref:TRAP transporter small permease protein n=1 Tax=Providencia rettgeri TaxID=587 RepID=A0A939SR11_PRORE|nr:TRAP transporter small permease subunit [Providencia rettgeri]
MASLAVAAIVIITILAVFMRWLLNDPLMWSEEVLIICYIWLVMIEQHPLRVKNARQY